MLRFGLTPLKGGAHSHPDSMVVSADGPVGDRRFALVEDYRSRGYSVVRTVENPAVLRVRPRLADDGTLSLDLPGESFVVAPDADPDPAVVADYWGRATRLHPLPGPWDQALSDLLGHPVRLARAEDSVVYAEPVTLVTTSSLAELARRAGVPSMDDERFRATVVVDTGDARPFVEDSWIGRCLRLGEVEVEVRSPVVRCAVTRLVPGTGDRADDDPVRLLAPDRRMGGGVVFAVGAVVHRPGTVRVGDDVGSVPG